MITRARIQNIKRTCLGADRQGCGYDINKLILKHPLTEGSYEDKCPQCGRIVRWTHAKGQ